MGNGSPNTGAPPMGNGVHVTGSSVDHESIHDTQDVGVQSRAHFMPVENQANITGSTTVQEFIFDSQDIRAQDSGSRYELCDHCVSPQQRIGTPDHWVSIGF